MTRLPLIALLALAACAAPDTASLDTAAPAAAQNAPAAASSPAGAFLARPADALVVDVRTPAEYASGHVAGAQNVDVNGGQFEASLDSVDRARPVYLYCRSGSRSAVAAEKLTQMGFQTVVNAGGFDALAAAGAETE